MSETTKTRVYVASSWRNPYQPEVVAALTASGYDVYDFRHPGPGKHGFAWADIDPEWQSWTPAQYIEALDHPRAEDGFSSDWEAMQDADAFVLVLPCGRSAHLEAGWAIGQGKPTLICLPDVPPGMTTVRPELMYKMATSTCIGPETVVPALKAMLAEEQNRVIAFPQAEETPARDLPMHPEWELPNGSTCMELAIEAARQSLCVKSQRGCVLWHPSVKEPLATGFNYEARSGGCPGSNECRTRCAETAIHAEAAAIAAARRSLQPVFGAEMVHITVMDGEPVPSRGPSCVECAKNMADGRRVWVRYLIWDVLKTSMECPGVMQGIPHRLN